MKIHWGTGIAIFMGCFMAMILGFVINSFQHDSELVSEDYYAQEIAYQDQIDKRANASDIDIKIGFNDQGMLLGFPEGAKSWKGNIAFFRPSDKALDFSLPIQVGESASQLVAQEQLASGLWRLKFEWSEGGKAFYSEKSVVVP